MAQMVKFADKKEAAELQVALNRCIREGREVVPETFNNSRLISYWFLIKSIKDDMLFLMRNNGPKAYIDGVPMGGEGYVKINNHGMFKLELLNVSGTTSLQTHPTHHPTPVSYTHLTLPTILLV